MAFLNCILGRIGRTHNNSYNCIYARWLAFVLAGGHFITPPYLTPLWGVQIGLNRIKQTYHNINKQKKQ